MIEDYSIRNEFSIYNAQRFMESIANQKLYIFLGKTSSWPDEDDPPTPTSSQQVMMNAWDNMIVTKRVNATNFSLAVKKNIWTSGTIYQPWDSEDGLLYDKKFFVITSANRVYKCLDRIPNTPSTVEPTDTGVTPVRLSDGYTWKFMYDISVADMNKFKDTEVIPVKYLTSNDGSLQWQVQEYAVPGTINAIEVLNGGSGYTQSPSVTITGDGSGAVATAVLEGNTLKYIIMTQPGQGYTWANVTITGTGSGATARAIISPIKGHGWNPVDELFGCSVISTVTFDGDESGIIPINIKFRQIGLISNPTLNGSTTIADITGANQQYLLANMSGVSGTFIEGEYLNNTTTGLANAAQVIKFDSNKLYLNVLKGPISANDQLQGVSSGTTGEVITTVPHTLENYSGDMLYLENRPPITKIENQSETYRLIIKF
jgi:hypothetical protein